MELGDNHNNNNNQMNPQEDSSNNNNNNNGVGKSSSYMCRQSSTRWTPTSEQIKLLKELYYINGVRSPTADQIQTICSRLRRYGKIEGKNVFYWFQNHKARERQKKRLTPTANIISNTAPPPIYHTTTKYNNNNNAYPLPAGVACSSSSGQVLGGFAYGAVTMENKFRDCSISSGGGVNHSFQWGGAAGNYNPYAPPPNPPHYTNFLGKISAVDEDHDYQYYDDHDGAPDLETLPLFPVPNEDHHHHDHHYGSIKSSGSADGYYYTGGYRWANGGGNGSAATSLELSLKINL